LDLLPRGLEIARQQRRGVYDGLYVALAEREGAQLVTADKQLLNLSGFPIIDLQNF
jgi:predicted nucleic acid-binding protein